MSAALHVVADDRAEWLEWRRHGIGASDAAAVAGFSPFDSPTSIYLKKIGFLREQEDEEDWQRAGRLLEPVIARWFEEDTGLAVAMPQAQVAHPDRPWQRATLDGVVMVDGEVAGPFESKSTIRWNGEWGPEPPDYYQTQLLHQMVVMGATRGWMATLTGNRQFRWWEIRRNELDADLLTSVEEAFWLRVIERRPPPVDGSARTNEALKAVYAVPVAEPCVLDDKGVAAVEELRQARLAKTVAEREATRAENAVLAVLAGAEAGTHRGRPIVTNKEITREAYSVPASTYRRLWLPKTKETA